MIPVTAFSNLSVQNGRRKHMKKIVAFLLAVTMLGMFAGCANNNQGSDGTDDSWTKVEQAGKLVMGMDEAFPPMGYKDTQTGEIIGFDIDVATEVCNRLGVELVKKPIDWNNQIAEVNNGNVDCLWNGLSKNEKREENLNLSIPYMNNNQVIMVKTDATFQNLADLAGKKLAVQAGSSAYDALQEATEFKNSLGEVVQLNDYAKATQEIKNGVVDAIAIDEVVARFYLTNEPDTYRILTNDDGSVISMAKEEYVIGFRKGDNALKAKIEDTLKEMAEDGTLAGISQKWFSEDVVIIEK